MTVKLILEFEELARSDVANAAEYITAEAENLTGEAPWWKVEDSDD